MIKYPEEALLFEVVRPWAKGACSGPRVGQIVEAIDGIDNTGCVEFLLHNPLHSQRDVWDIEPCTPDEEHALNICHIVGWVMPNDLNDVRPLTKAAREAAEIHAAAILRVLKR